MIESKSGKYAVMALMCLLAVLMALRAPPRKRRVLLPVSAGLVLWAFYIGVRTKTWTAPASSSLVGDVGVFVAEVPLHVAWLSNWARDRGWPLPSTIDAMAEWIWDHREVLGEEWPQIIRPLVAAYGETCRAAQPRLVWAGRRGDVVLEIPGRPWTRRRVALEVHDSVFADV